MAEWRDQTIITPADAGALPLAEQIHHIFCTGGAETHLLVRPGNRRMLVLVAEIGDWRLRLGGDGEEEEGPADMPAAFAVAADSTEGDGTLPLKVDNSVIIAGPSAVTVKGFTAGDVLTYYWA